jgi:hypothetical protein
MLGSQPCLSERSSQEDAFCPPPLIPSTNIYVQNRRDLILDGTRCERLLWHMQDRAAGTMQFTLARPGMLKHFEGQWTVTAVEGKVLMQITLPPCICAGSSSSCHLSLRRHTPKALQAPVTRPLHGSIANASESMCCSLEPHACLMMHR